MDVPLYDVAVSNSVKDDEGQHDEDRDAKILAKTKNGDAVYAACLCGAQKCTGYMFK
jgi:hypothetical protein